VPRPYTGKLSFCFSSTAPGLAQGLNRSSMTNFKNSVETS
jgi:hypothetical protein